MQQDFLVSHAMIQLTDISVKEQMSLVLRFVNNKACSGYGTCR